MYLKLSVVSFVSVFVSFLRNPVLLQDHEYILVCCPLNAPPLMAECLIQQELVFEDGVRWEYNFSLPLTQGACCPSAVY